MQYHSHVEGCRRSIHKWILDIPGFGPLLEFWLPRCCLAAASLLPRCIPFLYPQSGYHILPTIRTLRFSYTLRSYYSILAPLHFLVQFVRMSFFVRFLRMIFPSCSSSSKIPDTPDTLDIDLRALLDNFISYLSPTLGAIKEGIAWLGANVADRLSALRRFVTRHPYISIGILVGLVLLFVYGPTLLSFSLRPLLDILGFTSGGVAKGSLAAFYQSSVHGGYVASNSVFSWAQSLGATIVL